MNEESGMGQEKVTEYEQISEPDQAEVAQEELMVEAEALVSDWPQDAELGAVDPTDDDVPTRSAIVLNEGDLDEVEEVDQDDDESDLDEDETTEDPA